MKKIPTLFKRIFSEDHKTKTITHEVTPGCEAVLEGLCTPTVKWDGACCAIINGEIYKRYDAKNGKKPPEGAIPCQPEPDPITTHWPHWVKCKKENPADKYFLEALENFKKTMPEKEFFYKFCVDDEIRSLEAVGPSWQSNPYNLEHNTLVLHGDDIVSTDWADTEHSPSEMFAILKDYLEYHEIEGIVFWYDGNPLCKIKRSDFGFKWSVKEKDK